MPDISLQEQVFKKGSKTYFNSSIFFPKTVRDDVCILYAFVRVVDDCVDELPQDTEGFCRYKELYRRAAAGEITQDPIVDEFARLMKRRNFNPEWVEAFLNSMELDLTKRTYDTLDETLEYIYGSAEVIGLFMARIMELPEESLHAAQMQGRAMQYINFIRDIAEDLELGRRYLPLTGSALDSLERDYIQNNQEAFVDFHRNQVSLYEGWQREAEDGYRFIPKRYLVPIKTAAEMYLWTATKIKNNPLVVYDRKVKPKKPRIFAQIIKNYITL